jgi:hypothetical protein
MEKIFLSPEKKKIFSYLCKYGTVLESEVIRFGKQKLGLHKKEMKKLLAEMILYGELESVLHSELNPPTVYLKLGDYVPEAIEMQEYSQLTAEEKKNKQVEMAKDILWEVAFVTRKS